MLNDPLTITIACLAVFVLGLGKGGLAGLAALATPIMALGFPPITAAAILLPILVVQDGVSLWAFHKSWDRQIVVWMLPGAIVGIFAAYLLAAILPVIAVMAALGLITSGFGIWRLCQIRTGELTAPQNAPRGMGTLFGMMSGFTSQIAHAGGPPFQMWVTTRGLPHLTYLGTSTIFFAALNFLKLPAYFALGEFTRENLVASALLIPIAIGSSFAGIYIARKLSNKRFYLIVYVLMIVLGIKLIWDAWAT